MTMKRLLLFAIVCAAAFGACTKDDGGGSDAVRNVEIEVLAFDGDFRHINVDSAYVYNFASHFQKSICDKDGIAMPEVDFSTSALIAVTGVSPALAESITPALYGKDGKYFLKIDVKVSESEYVKPRKWSLLLKAPASVDPRIECIVEYDKPFDASQIPDSTFVYARENEAGERKVKLEPTVIMDDAYLAVVRKSDTDKVKRAVNADDVCIIAEITHITPSFNYQLPDGVSYDSCDGIVLKNCSYEKVIVPLGDTVLYVARGGYYVREYVDSPVYLFYQPYAPVVLKCACGQWAKKMFESLECEVRRVSGDHDDRINIGFGKRAKINVLQAYYMLAADGYMAEDHGSIRHFAVSASTFDSAVKQVYE